MATFKQLDGEGRLEAEMSEEIDSDDEESDGEEVEEKEPFTLDEDLFGFALASLIRDSSAFSRKRHSNKKLRVTRLVMSQVLLFLNMVLQIYVIIAIKAYVTAKTVHDIRMIYDKFEFEMYRSGAQNHTYHTVNGFSRGIDGPAGAYFQPERFMEPGVFTNEERSQICRIALSEPNYYMVIVCIWTLTCLGDVKRCIELFVRLVVQLDTTPAMYEEDFVGHRGSADPTSESYGLEKHVRPVILSASNFKDDFKQYKKQCVQDKLEDLAKNDRLVVGLSMSVKVYLSSMVLLPRFLITCTLLWLGCRWLTATTSFSDLLLNAVALEFVLMLKNLLYNTVVPHKNQNHVQHTLILPKLGQTRSGDYTWEEQGDWWSYFKSFGYLFATIAWVVFYMYQFQMVLPDYQWDVHMVCESYLAAFYRLTAGHGAT